MWVRASRELFWGFRASTNDDYDHDRTRMIRIKRINTDLRRICENARIRCPDCRTREGSQSVRIRFIRCIRVLFCGNSRTPQRWLESREALTILGQPAPPHHQPPRAFKSFNYWISRGCCESWSKQGNETKEYLNIASRNHITQKPSTQLRHDKTPSTMRP